MFRHHPYDARVAADEGRGRELERVLSAVQRRSEGRLAFDRVDADADAGSSSALLIWSPHHARIQELLPPEDVAGADDAGGAGGGTWLSRARPSGAFIQSAYASGLLCDELSDEPTQTVRFMLTEGNATDAAEADGGVAFHEEDCDAGLSRAHVLALLGRYRRVARQLGCADDGCYEVHAELEFDTQEGSLDEGDMLERHVRHVITLRGS